MESYLGTLDMDKVDSVSRMLAEAMELHSTPVLHSTGLKDLVARNLKTLCDFENRDRQVCNSEFAQAV